jgi:GT2 family glycosyltransferase
VSRRSVSVVVPTLEGGERLRRAVDSLGPLGDGREVVVVDNGGATGVAEIGGRPGVRVLEMGRNTGFSYAVNRGAEAALGDVLVVLNDDCVCGPGFLDEIAGKIDPGAGVVMAASVLLDPSDPDRIESAGMELDRSLSVFDRMNGEPVAAIGAARSEPIGPSAAAAAFDRRAFLAAGGFDEELFAYWEDVDLVLRLRAAGGRCALAAGARATHAMSATFGAGSPEKNRLMGFGRGYILRKWSVVTPLRLPAVLMRETAIVAGQLLLDRNASGAAARISGWRAARRTHPYPRATLAEHDTPSVSGQLWRRMKKRRRARGRRP